MNVPQEISENISFCGFSALNSKYWSGDQDGRCGSSEGDMCPERQKPHLCLQTNEEFKPLLRMNESTSIRPKGHTIAGVTLLCLKVPHFLNQGPYLGLAEC